MDGGGSFIMLKRRVAEKLPTSFPPPQITSMCLFLCSKQVHLFCQLQRIILNGTTVRFGIPDMNK